MNFSIQKTTWKKVRTGAVALFQTDDKRQLRNTVKFLGRNSVGLSAETLLGAGDMNGKKDELFVIYPKKSEALAKRVFLVGLGKSDKLSLEMVRRSAARTAKKALALKAKSLAVILPAVNGASGAEIAAAYVEGTMLGLYKFDKFFKKDEPKVPLESVTFLDDADSLHGSTSAEVKSAIEQAQLICDATIFARDMENEPSNNKFPETLGNWAKDLSKGLG